MTWLAVAGLAVALAVASPRESGILGKLPGQIGEFLGSKPAAAMAVAPADQRLLVLVSFHRDHRRDVESWIDGLSLYQDRSIDWIRMPVIQDAGDPNVRAAAESRLLARYVTPQERENLIPVFIDREMFLQSTGLPHEQSAYALVIKRNGDVLARIPGGFDASKAQTVRDALLDQDL